MNPFHDDRYHEQRDTFLHQQTQYVESTLTLVQCRRPTFIQRLVSAETFFIFIIIKISQY